MSLSKQQKGGKDCLLDFSISTIFILQIFIHENIVDYTQSKMLGNPKTNNVIIPVVSSLNLSTRIRQGGKIM